MTESEPEKAAAGNVVFVETITGKTGRKSTQRRSITSDETNDYMCG